MRHEILEDKNYEIVGAQKRYTHQIRRPVSVAQQPKNWDRTNSSHFKTPSKDGFDNYIRYADIVIGQKGKEKLVELKSYPGKNPVKDGMKYIVPKKSLTSITPFWNADKNTRLVTILDSNGDTVLNEKGEETKRLAPTRTIMHRQLLLDAMLTRIQLNEISGKNTIGKQANDFVWYFQDWDPITEKKKKKVKKKVKGKTSPEDPKGVSVTRLKYANREGSTTVAGEALDYIGRRLSRLGGRSSAGQSIVAFNLGIEKQYAKSGNDVLYDMTHNRTVDIGLVKDRIKSLPLWGDIDPDLEDGLLRDVFGIEPEGRVGQLIKTGSFDELDDVLEQIAKLEEEIEIDDDVIEKVERIGEWFDRKVEELSDNEAVRKADRAIERAKEKVAELYEEGEKKMESTLGKYINVEYQCL